MIELEGAARSCAIIDTEIWNISQYADAITNGGDPELEAEHIKESVVIIENEISDLIDYMEALKEAIK